MHIKEVLVSIAGGGRMSSRTRSTAGFGVSDVEHNSVISFTYRYSVTVLTRRRQITATNNGVS
jgi:hypothetical protein